MVEKGKEILKIYDLGRLRELADAPLSEDDQKFILVLNNHYIRSRYPDLAYKALPEPSLETTKKNHDQTKKLARWLMEYLENL